jgi:hypothetical protein
MEKELFTWRQLKEFVNGLPEDRLDGEVIAQEENQVKTFSGAEVLPDIYVPIDGDIEGSGPLEELKSALGDDFDINDYEVQPAGVPILWIEF